MAKPISSRTAILAVLAAMPGLVHSTPAPVGQEAQSAALDSIEQNLDPVEAQARRSLFGGGSKPVSFSGEAIMRFLGTSYDENPGWLSHDVTETKNSSASIRLAMVAAPHRNLRLWSKIAFNAQMLGYNKPANPGPDKSLYGTPRTGSLDVRDIGNYEDMCAGLIAKTGPVTTQTRIGGVLWTEASPLSLWKGQNRMFGWDYVPYELEQSSAQYYEYATIKGEKTGRAAWNKKPFQGLQFESIEMPWNLYYNVTYGSFDMGQKYQPFMINTNTTHGLMNTNTYGKDGGDNTDAPGPRKVGTKGIGIGDSYRKTLLLRFAKAELPMGITAGLNYVNYKTDDDYPKQFWNMWSGTGWKDHYPVIAWHYRDSADQIGKYNANYFVNTQVASVDFRRNLPGGLQFHVDIAMSKVDTAFFKVDTIGDGGNHWRRYGISDSATIVNAYQGEILGHSKAEWIPAVYGMLAYPVSIAGKNIDFQVQGIFAPKKFYSGSSFVLPVDAIFPYESNLTGAGKFAGADNGTPYASNLAGANLSTKLPVANGHAKINFGFHSQLENGSDFIFLPWRLNGTAFNYTLNASTSRYDGATLTDAYLMGNHPFYLSGNQNYDGTNLAGKYRQIRRMGNEFYWGQNPDGTERRNPYAPQPGLAGGIRNDYLATFEGFGAFRLRKEAAQREQDLDAIGGMFETGVMPQAKKATQNLSIDLSKDIARYWGGKNSLHLAFYGALNSITKSGSPIPTLSSNDDVLLSSYHLRFEPVVQLTQKLYLIGLFGHEIWKSNYGVAVIDSANGTAPSLHAEYLDPTNWYAAPIDYSDWAYGIGLDWDIAPRVGLHVRLQHFTHEDKGISKEVPTAVGKNDYKAWFLHAETKMWF